MEEGDLLVQKLPIGKNWFEEIITSIFNAIVVKWNGPQEHMSNHSMRTTVISMIIDSRNSDSSVMLRYGQTNISTLTRYYNLSILEGFKKQIGLFKKPFTALPFTAAFLHPFQLSNQLQAFNSISGTVEQVRKAYNGIIQLVHEQNQWLNHADHDRESIITDDKSTTINNNNMSFKMFSSRTGTSTFS